MEDTNYKNAFIEFMVRSEVLKFGDFTTKSGRKSPYFINTGEFNSGGQIARLGRFYAECIVDNIKRGHISEDIDTLFGPAYKGIPLAVSTSMALSMAYGLTVGYSFNRKESKDHGEGGDIVGYKFGSGEKVLVLDDVITAGTAIREVLPVIQSVGNVEIVGLVLAVDRMEIGQGSRSAVQEVKEDLGIPVFPIATVHDIINYLGDGKKIDGRVVITDDDKRRLEAYMSEYCV